MTNQKDQSQAIYMRVAHWWTRTAANARGRVQSFAQGPWRNSERHIAAAQIALEVERARRKSNEKGRER
jgi:hypothetical protein